MQPLAPLAPRVVPGRAVDIPDVAQDRGLSRGVCPSRCSRRNQPDRNGRSSMEVCRER
jgi:hypothetical protein